MGSIYLFWGSSITNISNGYMVRPLPLDTRVVCHDEYLDTMGNTTHDFWPIWSPVDWNGEDLTFLQFVLIEFGVFLISFLMSYAVRCSVQTVFRSKHLLRDFVLVMLWHYDWWALFAGITVVVVAKLLARLSFQQRLFAVYVVVHLIARFADSVIHAVSFSPISENDSESQRLVITWIKQSAVRSEEQLMLGCATCAGLLKDGSVALVSAGVSGLSYGTVFGAVALFLLVVDWLIDYVEGFPIVRTRYSGMIVPVASNGWGRCIHPIQTMRLLDAAKQDVRARGPNFDHNGVSIHQAQLAANLSNAIQPVLIDGRYFMPCEINGVRSLQPLDTNSEGNHARVDMRLLDLMIKGRKGDVLMVPGSLNLPQDDAVQTESPCEGSSLTPLHDLGNVPLCQGVIGKEDASGKIVDHGWLSLHGPLLILAGHSDDDLVDFVADGHKLWYQPIVDRGPATAGLDVTQDRNRWCSIDEIVNLKVKGVEKLAPNLARYATVGGTGIKLDDKRREPFFKGGCDNSVFPFNSSGGDIVAILPVEYKLENRQLHYNTEHLNTVYGHMKLRKSKPLSDTMQGTAIAYSYCPSTSNSLPSLCKAKGRFDFTKQTLLDEQFNAKRARKGELPFDSLLRMHAVSTQAHTGIGPGTSGTMLSLVVNGTCGPPIAIHVASYTGPERSQLGRMTNLCVPLFPIFQMIEQMTGLVLIERSRTKPILSLVTNPRVRHAIEFIDSKRRLVTESPNGNKGSSFSGTVIDERRYEYEEDQRQREEEERERRADEAAVVYADFGGKRYKFGKRSWRESNENREETEAERENRIISEVLDDFHRYGGEGDQNFDDEVRHRMHNEPQRMRRNWADLAPESPATWPHDIGEPVDLDPGKFKVNIEALRARVIAKFSPFSSDTRQAVYFCALQVITDIERARAKLGDIEDCVPDDPFFSTRPISSIMSNPLSFVGIGDEKLANLDDPSLKLTKAEFISLLAKARGVAPEVVQLELRGNHEHMQKHAEEELADIAAHPPCFVQEQRERAAWLDEQSIHGAVHNAVRSGKASPGLVQKLREKNECRLPPTIPEGRKSWSSTDVQESRRIPVTDPLHAVDAPTDTSSDFGSVESIRSDKSDITDARSLICELNAPIEAHDDLSSGFDPMRTQRPKLELGPRSIRKDVFQVESALRACAANDDAEPEDFRLAAPTAPGANATGSTKKKKTRSRASKIGKSQPEALKPPGLVFSMRHPTQMNETEWDSVSQ